MGSTQFELPGGFVYLLKPQQWWASLPQPHCHLAIRSQTAVLAMREAPWCVGPFCPGVGYNLLVCHLLRPLVKRSIRVGVTRFFRCCVSQFPLARKRDSLPPCTSQVRRCFALLQLSLIGLHQLTSTDCLALPSEMNPVPQLKMQKSPIFCVFCVACTGSWRLELFLFGHLGHALHKLLHVNYCQEQCHT